MASAVLPPPPLPPSPTSLSRQSVPQTRPPPLPPPPPPPPPLSRCRRFVLRTPDLDHVEDVDTYGPGGHYPVILGDVLGQRFKVIHKLGHGGFALVWLARDLEQDQYVALKVLRADAPHREVSTLKHLQTAAVTAMRIATLRETFTIYGPNGVHQCLVMDVGGPSLKHLHFHCKRPGLQFLKSASQKLAEGLAALHSAGICHGDLTHTNVLFEIKDFHSWSESQIYHYFGNPKTAPLLLLDGSPAPAFAPAHVVDALDFSGLSIDQLSGEVLIIDFGEAFFEGDVPQGLGTPASFFGPEMLFGYPPSFAADLWALGCLIFEIHTFCTLIPTAFGSALEALCMAVETIGALPEEWMGRYKYEDESNGTVFNREHRMMDDSIERTRTLDSQIFERMPNLPQEEHAIFVELLKSILVFEATLRLSAGAVAKHPWFVEK